MLNFYPLSEGYLKFSGADRLDLIDRLSTNEVNSLKEFRTEKTVLTSDKGRIIDLLTLYNFGDFVFASCSFENSSKVLAHLEKYTIMDDFNPEDLSRTHETILFCGENLKEYIGFVSGKDINSLGKNEFFVTESHDAVICLNDDVINGVKIIYSVKDKDYWTEILFSAKVMKEFSMKQIPDYDYEVKRIENGFPVSGKEMRDNSNPLECGLSSYVSFTKGCYIGQEVIARLDAYDKINKHLTGLKISLNGSVLKNELYKILTEGKECGYLTSHAVSEKSGCIGLGFIKTIFLNYNKKYKIKLNDLELDCRAVKLPFTN